MAQRGTYLACQTPACGFVYVLEAPGEIPACVKCGGKEWRTMDPPADASVELTAHDRRFLRSVRVSWDEWEDAAFLRALGITPDD